MEIRNVPTTKILETFENEYQHRDYEILIEIPEFTSVCPKTGLPDFGEIVIRYVPDELCLELKSVKYYFVAYRNFGVFYEHAVNQILDDLVSVCHPRRMIVEGHFASRGGITTSVVAMHPVFEESSIPQSDRE
ncbi:MAG: preQ(1) synthase [Planctomycetes bacterium]|nr:preQ(1) synthase [Planctomycetota bacterium]